MYVKYKFSKWHVPLLAAYETRDMLYKEISFWIFYIFLMLSLYLIKHGGEEVLFHAFLILVLDGREWSASGPGHFIPEETAPATP